MRSATRALWIAAWLPLALGTSSGPSRTKIDTIVIHTIGGPSCSKEGEVQFHPVKGNARTWKKYLEGAEGKGIHYIVDREGLALASIPEDQVAWHVVNHNQTSIGIELVNNGDGVEPFPAVQIDKLVILLCDIGARRSLTASAIKGHQDLDKKMMSCGGKETRRRVDPNALFPWQNVLERVEKCLAEGASAAHDITADDSKVEDVSPGDDAGVSWEDDASEKDAE
jgi:N-acetyl-anhydromuramyl-L-alanine amidase AmpD